MRLVDALRLNSAVVQPSCSGDDLDLRLDLLVQPQATRFVLPDHPHSTFHQRSNLSTSQMEIQWFRILLLFTTARATASSRHYSRRDGHRHASQAHRSTAAESSSKRSYFRPLTERKYGNRVSAARTPCFVCAGTKTWHRLHLGVPCACSQTAIGTA